MQKFKVSRNEFFYRAKVNGFKMDSVTEVLYQNASDFIELEGELLEGGTVDEKKDKSVKEIVEKWLEKNCKKGEELAVTQSPMAIVISKFNVIKKA